MGDPSRFGSYEILAPLGEGASGVVHRARAPDGREVALKILREECCGDAEIERRFRREARVLAGLDHPRVVRLFEAGSLDGRLFLVSELVPGGNVADLLKREGRLGEGRAVAILRDLLEALDGIAAAGLVHRDVKPANLLLDGEGRAKLADLGLARPISNERTLLTGAGMVVGTPAYLAPEQVRGEDDLDIRCDLYAAGALLYECLAGSPPFRGKSAVETMWMHLDAPVPPLPSAPPAIEAIVHELMAKARDLRPRTPADALARLDAAAPASRAAPLPAPLPALYPSTVAPVSAALQRLKLVLRRGAEARTLFLYAGTRLRMGRDGIDRSNNDVCLRLRPPGTEEEASRRISSRHLRFEMDDEGARLFDLGSRGGTTLDGSPVHPDAPRRLPPRCRIEVAGVLSLTVRALPGALLVERESNGVEHAYALVSGEFPLSAWAPDAGTVVHGGDALHFADGRPLREGLRFPAGPFEAELFAIVPGDQK